MIATPLTELTKKDVKFFWGVEQQLVFEGLKRHLTSFPILSHFSPDRSIEIWTDGSSQGVGAVLIQRDQNRIYTIAFSSKSLNRAQKQSSATSLEVFAVVFGIGKYQTYLCGNVPFAVVTDHAAIVPLLKTKTPGGQLARWLFRIAPYRFHVVYRPGRENTFADALSRYPVPDTE
jgi:RNase H-like domain found in reverse transcriptase